MNKNFYRLALLYKTRYNVKFKDNSSFLSTESHQQMLLDYEDLITLLQITSSISPILFQVIKLLNSLS